MEDKLLSISQRGGMYVLKRWEGELAVLKPSNSYGEEYEEREEVYVKEGRYYEDFKEMRAKRRE